MDGKAGTDATEPARRRLSPRPRVLFAASLAAALAIAVATILTAAGGTGETGSRPQSARGFSLTELGSPGARVSLAAYSGRPVVINFFASWCGPCKRETPLLAKFYAEHHGRIAVIGVDSNDQANAALQFLKSEGVGYPVGFDPFPAAVAESYGVIALPQTYLLNPRHQIVRHIGGDVTQGQLAAFASNPERSGPG